MENRFANRVLYSIQMRLLYPDSRFLDKCYDPAIVGYDSVTGAVIYDDEDMLNLSMGMFEPNKHPDIMTWCEQFEFCISQIQSMFCQECQDGKVPPVLLTVFPEDDLSEYIDDIQSYGDSVNSASNENYSKLAA